EKHGILGREKTLGQLFPAHKKATDVVAVFKKLLDRHQVPVISQTRATHVESVADGFAVHCQDQAMRAKRFEGKKVVFASGGLPIPKLGASDFALRMARDWGMAIEETRPALVPLTITGRDAE